MLNYLICKKEEERAEQLICICNTFKAFVLFLEKKKIILSWQDASISLSNSIFKVRLCQRLAMAQ